jgi:hypothetical protein
LFNRYYSERHLGAFFCGLLLISSIFVVYNVGTLNAQNSWWNPGWAYRKMITVDHAKVSADLSGFPFLVDIVDVDLVSKAKSDGGDVVFTDQSGNKLNHEIEFYDNVTGHLVCWVNTDLSSSVDTELYMYYGNPEAANQENPTGVWNSGYAMVQHLAETQASPASEWHKFEGNPTLNGSQNGFASVFYDNSSGVYHLFCSWGSILHFTSSNGKTGWAADPLNPILTGNNEGVPMVWEEEGVWYMLYRYGGPDKIGLANSTDASHWTRYEGNPVINVGSFCDPWGVIKVGSTYYLWYNDGWGTGGRCAGLATSTDLKNWTQDPNNPIFTDGRFCVFPFKYDGYYYTIVPRYTTSPYGEIELYRDVNPTFYPTSREYLGVIIRPGPAGAWDDHRFDTPCVLTDTIQRDSYEASNNELWTYYGGTGTLTGSGADWWTGMCIEQNITDALTRVGATRYSHFDSTANHNDGQAGGQLNMNVTGKVDGADHFNAGTQDYVNCGDSSSLKGMNALTVETWVKPDLLPGGGTGIVAKWSSWTAGSGGSYILWQGSSGTVGWGVITETSSAFFYDTPVLQPGAWYHLVGTYDGAQIKLYINGSQVGTPTSVTGRIASTSDACYIGRYTTPYFNGTMDEVRISNVARTPAWIQTEYSNQQSPSAFYSIGTEETQTRAVLSVDPSLTQKTPSDVGTTFDINVTVSNVTDLFGFEFNLTWDKDLIRLVNVDYESTLDSIWGLGNWVMVRNDTAPRWYRLVAVSTLSGFTTTTSRPITRLAFKVEAFYNWMAETSLHFSVVKLSNSQANPILTDAADGTYRIDAQKPLVEIISDNILLRKYAERFNATVNIDHALGVKDFQFEIYYNASMLTYVPGSDIWGDLGIGLLNVNETEGSITGSVSSLTSLTGRHWLLNLTFQDALRRVWRDEASIPGWMNNQSGRILFRWVNLSYLNHADLRYQEGGSDQIVVTELHYVFSPIQGDTDNDGHVDVFDLRIIGYYYDIKSSDPGWTEASKYDLNGDNIIDVYDLVLAEYNFGYVYDC